MTDIIEQLRNASKELEESYYGDPCDVDLMDSAADEIERLRKLTERQPIERQPIETAPKDGTSLLLWFDDGQIFHEYAIQGFHSARAWRTEIHVSGEPTHWMPLPGYSPSLDECNHDWLDATNEAIQGGEVCIKCFAIRETPLPE